MSEEPPPLSPKERLELLRERLALDEDGMLADVLRHATALRDEREFAVALQGVELARRRFPDDSSLAVLQAQALIDTGLVTAAVPVLEALRNRLPETDPMHAEAAGLLGRAWKQVWLDADDKSTDAAMQALDRAVHEYEIPYRADPAATWHGVNLLAVLRRARSMGHRLPGPETRVLAADLLARLDAVPDADRDGWHWPTTAEAALGLDTAAGVARAQDALRRYVADPKLEPFKFASTLRQFTQVWDLGSRAPWGPPMLEMLRGRLLKMPGAELSLPVDALQESSPTDGPTAQALLGDAGVRDFVWWRAGLERARSVVAIRRLLGGRRGSGFLIRAGDLRPLLDATGEPIPGLHDDDLLVMTNYHVVNPQGEGKGIAPAAAEVAFEALDGAPRAAIVEIVWSSPEDVLDASLLRIASVPPDARPMPLAQRLPAWPAPAGATPRVYVLGYPGGRELAFSFQDNELLGHEGRPDGHPPNPMVRRVHYRAPTEPGSSGSAVFDDDWNVIALHHSGGKYGMPRLNGEPGTYGANEGIAIEAIAQALFR